MPITMHINYQPFKEVIFPHTVTLAQRKQIADVPKILCNINCHLAVSCEREINLEMSRVGLIKN